MNNFEALQKYFSEYLFFIERIKSIKSEKILKRSQYDRMGALSEDAWFYYRQGIRQIFPVSQLGDQDKELKLFKSKQSEKDASTHA